VVGGEGGGAGAGDGAGGGSGVDGAGGGGGGWAAKTCGAGVIAGASTGVVVVVVVVVVDGANAMSGAGETAKGGTLGETYQAEVVDLEHRTELDYWSAGCLLARRDL